jgi:hypothetical protein
MCSPSKREPLTSALYPQMSQIARIQMQACAVKTGVIRGSACNLRSL